MKMVIKMVVVLIVSSLWSTALVAESCQSQYMKDPCSVDGYTMVEIEEFIKAGHNHMYDIHHMALPAARKKHKKSRYRYVKQCRYVKVRR